MAKGTNAQPTPWSDRAVLVWTTPEIRAQVKRIADAEQCSVAAVGRRALTHFLEHHARTEETTMPTAQQEKPTREELRWRMIADLLDWDPGKSKAKLEHWSDAELRAAWYAHRDAERQRAGAVEEQVRTEQVRMQDR